MRESTCLRASDAKVGREYRDSHQDGFFARTAKGSKDEGYSASGTFRFAVTANAAKVGRELGIASRMVSSPDLRREAGTKDFQLEGLITAARQGCGAKVGRDKDVTRIVSLHG